MYVLQKRRLSLMHVFGWAASLILAYMVGYIARDAFIGPVFAGSTPNGNSLAHTLRQPTSKQVGSQFAEGTSDDDEVAPSTARMPSPEPLEPAAVAVDALATLPRVRAHCELPIQLRAQEPYQYENAIAADPVLANARTEIKRPSDEQLRDMAIVTMASNDEAARAVTALMQSLLDVGTRVPNLEVMLIRGGEGSEWCNSPTRIKARGRPAGWTCGSNVSLAEEIVSPQYLLTWERMGVKYRAMDPMPATPYTEPAGDTKLGGLAMNKLRVFSLVKFKKVMWIDADTLVFHNIDHLLLEPPFTAAFAQGCQAKGTYSTYSAGKMGGGLWVLQPSYDIWREVERVLKNPNPSSEGGQWNDDDAGVVAQAFSTPVAGAAADTKFPFSIDERYGILPGVRRFLPEYRKMSDAQWAAYVTTRMPDHVKRVADGALPPEGMWPAQAADAQLQRARWGAWNALDVRFDGVVGNCQENGPERDLGPDFFAVQFSCMPTAAGIKKPSMYKTEDEFLHAIMTRAPRCMRYYLLRWYEIYRRPMGKGLPEPAFGGKVALDAPEADAAFSAAAPAAKTSGAR